MKDADRSGPDAEKRVIKSIVDAVLAQRLQPGDRLVERELSDASGAGRMAVRNGLIRLANAGLVELSRNRGALVVQPTVEEAQEIFEARIVIEEAALRKLALTITDDGLQNLREIVEQEARAFAEDNIEEARRHSRQFHVSFVKLSGNGRMARFLEDLINCQPLLSNRREGQPTHFCGAPAHRATVDALSGRDGDKAAWLNSGLLRELEQEMDLDRAQPETDEIGEQSQTSPKTGSRADTARRGTDQTT